MFAIYWHIHNILYPAKNWHYQICNTIFSTIADTSPVSMMTNSINWQIMKTQYSHNHRTHKSYVLTHWGWMTHICVGILTPTKRQAIIWTNTSSLSIVTLGTKFSEILIEIQTFSFTTMQLKKSSGLFFSASIYRPQDTYEVAILHGGDRGPRPSQTQPGYDITVTS